MNDDLRRIPLDSDTVSIRRLIGVKKAAVIVLQRYGRASEIKGIVGVDLILP